MEGGDFVDSLADVDSFAEEILIDVGNGAAVDVDCRISGVEPSEERAGSAFWGDLDPRLHDRVASADSTRCLIEVGTVKGVCERAHEAAHGSRRERRVRVGRNNEPDAAERIHIALGDREARGLLAQHETVELLKLASLPFPPHPAVLGGVKAA